MKKVLGSVLLLALLASSAFASGESARRTVGLFWGTWTPQGFVVASDTTFINGNLAADGGELDTTSAFSASDMDFFPMFGGADANAVVPAMQANFVATGTTASSDSAFCTVEFSWDGNVWQSSSSPVSQGLLAYSSSSFGFVYGFNRSSSTPTGVLQSSLPWAPLYRFIFRGDGNTANRLSGVKASVTYFVAGENTPRATFKKMKFGTWAAGVFSATSDTSTIAASKADTTSALSLADVCLPSGNVVPFGGTAADSSVSIVQIVLVDAVSSVGCDSIYVNTEHSPDGFNWRTNLNKAGSASSTIDGRQLVFAGGTSGTGLDGNPYGIAHAALGGVPVAFTQSRFWGSSLLFAQNIRFKLVGGVTPANATSVWACYFRAPSKR